MKKYLACLLLCVAVHSAEFPAQSQTPSRPKLSAARQQELDEKLMSSLSGRRGQCDSAPVQSLIQQGARLVPAVLFRVEEAATGRRADEVPGSASAGARAERIERLPC